MKALDGKVADLCSGEETWREIVRSDIAWLEARRDEKVINGCKMRGGVGASVGRGPSRSWSGAVRAERLTLRQLGHARQSYGNKGMEDGQTSQSRTESPRGRVLVNEKEQGNITHTIAEEVRDHQERNRADPRATTRGPAGGGGRGAPSWRRGGGRRASRGAARRRVAIRTAEKRHDNFTRDGADTRICLQTQPYHTRNARTPHSALTLSLLACCYTLARRKPTAIITIHIFANHSPRQPSCDVTIMHQLLQPDEPLQHLLRAHGVLP